MSTKRQPSAPPKIPGYEYVRLVGMGGFADVFEYRQEFPKRSVAVKVLLSGSLDQGSREAFFAEANLMAQLSHHPSMVTIYQADIAQDGRPYLVMEFCSRPSLGQRYRKETISVAEALRTGIRVASAVETAHRLNILHRDIKPANILATDFGWPALTDFGIASTSSGAVSTTGMSIPWAPPELLAEMPQNDVRADVYSLAATLYTVLAGRSPFEIPGRSNTPAELLARIERDPLPAIERTDVPLGLFKVLQKGMEKEPQKRYPTALAFAQALTQVEISLQLPSTSVDLPQEILSASRVSFQPDEEIAPEGFDEGDQRTRLRAVREIDPSGSLATNVYPDKNDFEADQATRLRMPTSIDPQGSNKNNFSAPTSAVNSNSAPTGVATANTDHDVFAEADQATRFSPIRSINAHESLPTPGAPGNPAVPNTQVASPKANRGAGGWESGTENANPEDHKGSESETANKVKIIVSAISAALIVLALTWLIWSSLADKNKDSNNIPTQAPTLNQSANPTAEEEPDAEVGAVPMPSLLSGTNLGDGTAEFQWTNPSPQEGDAYIWTIINADENYAEYSRTEDLSVIVPIPEDSVAVCIEVSIVRDDGRSSQSAAQACSR